MNAIHRRFLICALAGAVSLQAAPFLAIGDNAELFLTATAGVRYEDNVLLTEKNTKDDVVLQFVPGLELTFGKNSLFSGSLIFQETISEYVDNSKLSNNLESVFFNSAYKGTKLTVKANASYREVQQNTRDVLNAAALTRRNVINAGINGELVLTEKSKVGAGFAYADTHYKTAGYNDSTTYTTPVNYYFAVTPKIDLSAGIRYRQTQVQKGNDYDDLYYNIGARGKFTPKLSGKFSVGYTERDPDVGAKTGLLGLDFDLDYLLTPKTGLKFTASNDFAASSTGGVSQEILSLGLSASTQISTQLAASASVNYQDIDYRSGRSDDFLVFGLSASYAFNQHIAGILAYSFQDNDSNVAGASFTANVVSLSASLRY